MRKIYWFVLAIIIFSECSENSSNKNFSVTFSHSSTLSAGTPISIIVKSDDETMDSVSFSIDNFTITLPYAKTNTYTIQSNTNSLGLKEIITTIYYDSKSEIHTENLTVLSNIEPTYPTFKVLNTYNHSIKSYTQGLEFSHDSLYEGTGLYGESFLQLTDYKNANIINSIPLASEYFGEGITILNNIIYQLTWQSKIGFIYNKSSFRQIGTFNYSTEGWGLCNDGKNLILSDGTEFLYIYNPENFSLIRRIAVYDNKAAVTKLNELEYVNGYIYANVYQTDFIVKIEAKSGKVIEWINLKNILAPEFMHEDIDVLNGIAWNSKSNTLFVTGKKWPKMFEIEIENSNKPL